MNNSKKGADYNKVSPDLVKKVKEVIAEADKHIYSVSRVYAAYNAIFNLREAQQSCSSCLRNRSRDLRIWLKGYDEHLKKSAEAKKAAEAQKITDEEIPPQYDKPAAAGYVPQADGTVRYPMSEGVPFDFLPNKGTLVKGKVKRADGSSIKPGSYTTEEGLTITVQPGSKATIKEAEEDLT